MFLLLIFLFNLIFAMPPRPGSIGPEPTFPPGVEVPGENKLKGFRTLETVCILMQFPDNRADTIRHSAARFDSMLYSIGVYRNAPYRQGSLTDYFLENSYGQYTVLGGIAGNRWFTSQYNYSRYYDGNYMLSTGAQLARENCQQVDQYVDFRQFDINGDNRIDALFMVHAGPGGEDTRNVNHCWSHAIPSFTYQTNDGVTIYGVTNVPEINLVTPTLETTLCCIAVMCHELGHLVGLPDLYDPTRNTWGIGYWGLMGYGAWGAGGNTPWSPSHMEAWSKVRAGFVTPILITHDTFNLKILDIETHPVCYKVWRQGLNTDTCFYLENRQKKGFDTPLPGPGLLIWHIDPAQSSYHNIVDLEEDSTFHLDHGTGVRPDPHYYHEALGDTSDPLPGIWQRLVFDNNTKPNSRNRVNQPTNVGVRNIRMVGDTIICDITLSATVRDVGVLSIVSPIGTVDSGSIIIPACTLYNFGTTTENYSVRMKIGNFYDTVAFVNNHQPVTKYYLTFPNWLVNQPAGNYLVSCSTQLTNDLNRINDKKTDSVTIRGLVGISEKGEETFLFKLSPKRSSLTMGHQLGKEWANLRIYNVLGEIVYSAERERFNIQKLPPGIYFLILTEKNHLDKRKLIVIK
ncbi:MAG: M6 family metalloprotease domain-containing protein [candidate division WOR-3 bacterium]